MTDQHASGITADDARALTTAWVNAVRAEENIGGPPLTDLPVAYGGTSTGCPIARALTDLEVDGGRFAEVGEEYLTIVSGSPRHSCAPAQDVHLHLPGYARAFIAFLERGCYPDLLRVF